MNCASQNARMSLRSACVTPAAWTAYPRRTSWYAVLVPVDDLALPLLLLLVEDELEVVFLLVAEAEPASEGGECG